MAPGGNQEEAGGGGGGGGNGGPDHGRAPPVPRRSRNWGRFHVVIALYTTCASALLLRWNDVVTALAVDPKLSDMLHTPMLMLLSAGMAFIVQLMWSLTRR